MKVINNICEQHRGTKHQQVKQNNIQSTHILTHTQTHTRTNIAPIDK